MYSHIISVSENDFSNPLFVDPLKVDFDETFSLYHKLNQYAITEMYRIAFNRNAVLLQISNFINNKTTECI